jgi:uncharacterized protein YigE (DUF2233 family)
VAGWVLGLVLMGWVCLGVPLGGAAGDLDHSAPRWQTLGRGLSFCQVEVLRDEEVMGSLAVVKIDPASNAFRVFHHAPQKIAAWQQEVKAPVVFNASYYDREGRPVGLILADGKAIGPPGNSKMRGMFVAEPRGLSPDLPRATILDLTSTRVLPQKLPWVQGVQSFPLLLDGKGRIRVHKSEKAARRTVIATDHAGNILVFNTYWGTFTLYDFAQFLLDSDFEVETALNLDGGTEAQLLIKTRDLEFSSPQSWEKQLGSLWDSRELRLPTVVAVFPR